MRKFLLFCFAISTQAAVLINPYSFTTVSSVNNTFDYIGSFTNSADGASSTLAVTTSGIVAGNLICVWVKNETAQTLTGVSGNVTGAFSLGTQKTHANNDLHGRWAYVVATGADTTITCTFSSAAATFRRAIVSIWAPYTTPVLDTQVTASGTSTAPNSGNITTAGGGLVLGGYSEYSAGHPIGMLIGTNGCINMPDAEWASIYTQSWAYQPTAAATLAASLTISGSAEWVCNAIAFKGTGARTTTGTNYAHMYIPMTNQTTGTTVTTTIMNNGSKGVVGTYTLNPSTPTGLIVNDTFVNKTYPVFVSGANGGVYNTGDASKAISCTNTVTATYAALGINRHPRLTISGFFIVNANANSGPYDLVVVAFASHFAVIQYKQFDENLRIETNPGGSTTLSPGFTPTRGSIYKFSLMVDTVNTLCSFKVWDSSGNVVCNDTPTLDSTHVDIDTIRMGQNEFGTSPAKISELQHIMVDYWGRFPIEP